MAVTDVAPPDPYTLTTDGIKEPPVGWKNSFRYLGPGLILSASIVGSGELIATTALGAKVGFVLLWLVVFSTLVKVAIQIELARWTIVTGEPALTGYNRVPPKVGRLGWVNLLWVVLALSKVLQLGGIIGGVAAASSLLLPIFGEPLSTGSLTFWTLFLMVLSIALLWSSKYALIERVAVALVVVFSLVTILIALGLPLTPFAYSGGDLASGLTFLIPVGALGAALAMFGITGVGADEVTYYTYWCVEKGYARWTGPNDGTQEWADRANGWIRVMQKDAAISWVVYTFGTLAFYLMGAAVLNPQGLEPEGNDMISTLQRIYTDTLGAWAGTLFLVGAIAVLGSTMWAALPSWSRMWANLLSSAGVFEWKDPKARRNWVRVFTVVQPILWAISYLYIQSPVVMVQIGGVMTGIFLVAVVISVWYLRNTETDPRVKGGKGFNVWLIVSSVAIAFLGIYTLLTVFGLQIG
jgi:Mn2+/Fe2+ NRAMP family transporter